MDAIRSKRGNRRTTMKNLDKDTTGSGALAIFDLDGTIMSTNVIEQYLWARLPELSRTQQLAEVGQVIRHLQNGEINTVMGNRCRASPSLKVQPSAATEG